MSQNNEKDPFDINFDDDFLASLDDTPVTPAADPLSELDTLANLDDNLTASSDATFPDFEISMPELGDDSISVDEPLATDAAPTAATVNSALANIENALNSAAAASSASQAAANNPPPADAPVLEAAVGAAALGGSAAVAAKTRAKKSLFAKKTAEKKDKKLGKTSSPPVKSNKQPLTKNPIALVLGGVGVLLLLGLLWLFLSKEDTPAPVVTPVAPVETAPAPAPEPTPDPVVEEVPAEPAAAAVPELNIDTTTIDAEAIEQAEIPEDPALIKEEIDRLSDKGERLSEQAKLIDEQLTMMADLTTAKEEQIALLEAQIAQLEAQKGSQ